MTVWRQIAGFDGYEVSESGDVRKLGKLLALKADRKGYLSVVMFKDGKHHTRTVARLVADAFIGPRPAGQQVRHKNGIKSDNQFSNLEYGTQTENEHDKRRHGTAPIGSNHPCAKLQESQVREIRARYVPYHSKNGASAIGREFGLTGAAIGRIVRGIAWSHLQ